MSTGCCPATIGSVATSICVPSTANCSCAAGRWTSSDAISTFLRSFSFSRLAILAVDVVLPDPCRPTIMTTAGGVTSIIRSDVSDPSIAVSWSLTILTTCCPGVTDRSTLLPTASSVTLSTKSRTTGRATSASSSATRTSRIAERTSASVSAPRPAACRIRRPDGRKENRTCLPLLGNRGPPKPAPRPGTTNTPVGENSPTSVHPWTARSSDGDVPKPRHARKARRLRRSLSRARQERQAVPAGPARTLQEKPRALPVLNAFRALSRRSEAAFARKTKR